ncbi:beta-galactosidase trimerization domain-containing protein [bacterium]|nr:beta-galactosidase trimerization domain-containing protein [bacterium]
MKKALLIYTLSLAAILNFFFGILMAELVIISLPEKEIGAMDTFPVGPLDPVQAVRQRPEWTSHLVLVWQYETDILKDESLYKQAGLHGFHIDRGAGEHDLVKFSMEKRYPYYVDHAAGKGILYLRKEEKHKVTGKNHVFPRPYSLADPLIINELKDHLRKNVDATKKGFVLAYAFDDEISLGSFNNPAEVDVHQISVTWYRVWLKNRYKTISLLNESWGKNYQSFEDVQPVSFEDIRKNHVKPPFAGWNLSCWSEWRAFMDFQFASVLSDLTRYTNGLDPNIPAGFVGGQGPSAYGGYDYSLLCRAVQWMEAYDYNGTAELLRSFWDDPRRIRMQTYFTGDDYYKNSWALWYRIANGCQGSIAWPSGWFNINSETGKREPSKKLTEIAQTLRDAQGKASEFISHPDTVLDTDPIGIYYSHPSVRAGWVMDCIVHGSTWPKRSSSIDDDNLTSGKLRVSWCKLLEDTGYQYNFISYLDVQEKRIDLSERYKVIIMPQIICISDAEATALSEFVSRGGVLIADALCGLMTETGKGRSKGAIDDVFAISRKESLGYMNGRSITEINGELYNKPLEQRLEAYNGAIKYKDMIVYERGTKGLSKKAEPAGTADVHITNYYKKGKAHYLNLTPVAYHHYPFRNGKMGKQWRKIINALLKDAGLNPRVEVIEDGSTSPLIESLLWRNGNRYCLALIKNYSYSEGISGEWIFDGGKIEPGEVTIHIKLNLDVKGIKNIRTGKDFGSVNGFSDSFREWEANFYEFEERNF